MSRKFFDALKQKIHKPSREETDYSRYAADLEQMQRSLVANLHKSSSPAESVQHALAAACTFYGGDWAGFLVVDMDLNLWTPYMWHNADPNDKTLSVLNEIESSEFLQRWVAGMKSNSPIILHDCSAVRKESPREYAMYQRLNMRSVMAVPVRPFPTGFLVVRNPTRYTANSNMLQLLSYVVVKGVSEKQRNDSIRLTWSPEMIRSDKDIIINLLGELEVFTSNGFLRESDLNSPKISCLLAYLTLHPTRSIPARELAEALWPDESEVQSNPGQNLKQLVFRLRQHCGKISDQPLIITTGAGYQLNPELHVMTDIQQFKRLRSLADSFSTTPLKVGLLTNALELYRGAMLPSASGNHWVIPTARRFELEYLEVADELMKTLFELRDFKDLLGLTHQVLQHSSGHVKAYFWLIMAARQLGSEEFASKALQDARKLLMKEEYSELTRQLEAHKDIPYTLRPFRATR